MAKTSAVQKNLRRIKYPEFYKILITKPVAEKLNLDNNLLDIIINVEGSVHFNTFYLNRNNRK